MKCKYCKTELPATARFCDHCGKEVVRETGVRQSKISHEKMSNIRLFIAAMVVLVPIILAFVWVAHIVTNIGSEYRATYEEQQQALHRLSVRVTAEMCNKIDPYGDTYEDVVDIIGEDGVRTYSGTDTTEYTWLGEYDGKLENGKSQLRISFNDDDGIIDWFEEVNIIDGDEVYQNQQEYKEAKTSLSDAEIEELPDAASYATICEAMGSEGVLINSAHDNDGTYRVYRWRHLVDNAYIDVDLGFINNRYAK